MQLPANAKQTTLLFLDGFGFSLVHASEWIAYFLSKCETAAHQVERFEPYSYRNWDEDFSLFDTYRPLPELIRIFLEHIEHRARVIPVGYSLGAVVALAGSVAAIARSRASIERVILVAPATSPDKDIINAYGRALTRQARLENIQTAASPVATLLTPEGQAEMLGWYRSLAEARIKVDVLYSFDDVMCPTTPPKSDPPYHEYINYQVLPIEQSATSASQRPGRGTLSAIHAYHKELLHHEATLRELCALIRAPVV